MSVIHFTVQYDLRTNDAENDVYGSDDDVALVGPVTFTPLNKDHKPLLAPDYSPRPTGYVIRAVTGYLDSDGRLRAERSGSLGVRLPANDPVLQADQVVYKVDFDLTTPLGVKVRVDGGFFSAPSEDIVVNLADVLEPTGSAVAGMVREAGYTTDIIDSGAFGRSMVQTANSAGAWSLLGVTPSQNLPSYVDDVVEFANQAAFPATGETGKIYVDLSTGDTFRWSGSQYIRVSDRVTASGITDSTSLGRSLITAATQRDARLALGGPVFYAADYGVNKNGSGVQSNNVANLLDCFSQCVSAGGGTVVLPAGIIDTSEVWFLKSVTADSGRTYTVKGGIPLPDNTPITVIGQGRGVTTIKLSAGFPRAFDLWNPNGKAFRDITIRDLTIDRNNITGHSILPYVTYKAGQSDLTLAANVWTTVDPSKFQVADGSTASLTTFRNATAMYASYENTGTASGSGAGGTWALFELCTTADGLLKVQHRSGSSKTIKSGDSFRGVTMGHVVVGFANTIEAQSPLLNSNWISWGFGPYGYQTTVDNLLVERVECENVPTPMQFASDSTVGPDWYLSHVDLTARPECKITNVTVRECKLTGGTGGVMMTGTTTENFSVPQSQIAWYDEIWVYDTLHDTGIDITSRLSSSIPSYFACETLTYATKSAFPATGNVKKFYVDSSTATVWRWVNGQYVNRLMPLGGLCSNFYIGGGGRVGRCGVVRCTGRGSHDLAMEMDSVWDGLDMDNRFEEFNGFGFAPAMFQVPAATSDGPTVVALKSALTSSSTSALLDIATTHNAYDAVTNPNGFNEVRYDPAVNRHGLVLIDNELIWYTLANHPMSYLYVSSTATNVVSIANVPKGHGISVGETITVSGATPAGFNGDFVVTSVTSGASADTISYTSSQTGTSTTSATVWPKYAHATLQRGVNDTVPASHSAEASVVFVDYERPRIRSIRTTIIGRKTPDLVNNHTGTPIHFGGTRNLPLIPMTMRDCQFTVYRGGQHGGNVSHGTFLGWDGWLPDLDVQGCKFIQVGLNMYYRNEGAAIAGRSPTTVRKQAGGTALTELACAAPRIYGRDNIVLVTGNYAGGWSGNNVTGADKYAVFRPGAGYYRLDWDVEADVNITNATPGGVSLVRLLPDPASVTKDTTSASGTGSVATIGVESGHDIRVGDVVTITTIVPTGYQGTYTVTAATDTSISFACTATGSQTTAGTIQRRDKLVVASGSRLGLKPINLAVPVPPNALVIGSTDFVSLSNGIQVDITPADLAGMTAPWVIDPTQIDKVTGTFPADNSDGTASF